MPLTDIAIRSAKPNDKPYKLADAGGLYLHIQPNGSRLWRMKYRFGGREKLLSIGTYPLIGLKAARDARDDAKRTLAAGRDPSAEKAASKREETTEVTPEEAVVTFADVANDWLRKCQREGRAEATLSKNTWLLDFAITDFGSEPVDSVKPNTVLASLQKLEARGKHESARRMRSVVGSVFRFAVATARADSDPTYSLQGALTRPTVTPRAALTDPDAFGGLLRAVWSLDGAVEIAAGLRLLALLFPRPGELRLAKWDEFDFEKDVWIIPAARAKMRRQHVVPLGPEAKATLLRLRQFQRSDIVFPNNRSDNRPLSENTFNATLRRLGFAQTEATAHGFRASASTLLNESGQFHADAIERALGHVEGNDVRRAYARSMHWDERVRMASWWEKHCAELREKKPPLPTAQQSAFSDLIA